MSKNNLSCKIKNLYSKHSINCRYKFKKHVEGYYRIPSDIIDSQWEAIKYLFERNNDTGKHLESQDKPQLANAVLCINKTGCQWRYLLNDFPNYSTVSSFYHCAICNGFWEKVLFILVEKTRVETGRNAEPSYGLIDSQSAKTAFASEERSYDGGKKVKGHKRHIVIDVIGKYIAHCCSCH